MNSTLSDGAHDIKVVFADGNATFTFSITNATETTDTSVTGNESTVATGNSLVTGDNSNSFMWLLVLIASVSVISLITYKNKKYLIILLKTLFVFCK